jgi:DNA-binding MarR family transcriptional regulator
MTTTELIDRMAASNLTAKQASALIRFLDGPLTQLALANKMGIKSLDAKSLLAMLTKKNFVTASRIGAGGWKYRMTVYGESEITKILKK